MLKRSFIKVSFEEYIQNPNTYNSSLDKCQTVEKSEKKEEDSPGTMLR